MASAVCPRLSRASGDTENPSEWSAATTELEYSAHLRGSQGFSGGDPITCAMDATYAAPAAVSISGDKDVEVMVAPSECDAQGCGAKGSSAASADGSIPDGQLSAGFEGRCRLYTCALQVFVAMEVFFIIFWEPSEEVTETTGVVLHVMPIGRNFILLKVMDELGTTWEFVYIGMLAFGAMAPNFTVRHTHRPCRRGVIVLVALPCLLLLQVRFDSGGTGINRLRNDLGWANWSAYVLVCASALLADVLFVLHFLPMLFSCFFACAHEDTRSDEEGKCCCGWGCLRKAWDCARAAVVFYWALAARAFLFALHTVRSLGRLPEWTARKFTCLQESLKSRWISLREDESYCHSVWMISTLTVSGIVILFLAVSIPLAWVDFVGKYKAYRDCVAQHKGLFQDILLGLGFGDKRQYYGHVFPGGTSNDTAMETFYLELAKEARSNGPQNSGNCALPRHLNDLYALMGTRLDSNSSGFHVRDVDNPTHAFEQSLTGQFVLYADAAIVASTHAVWIGFTISALFGVNSMLSVLARYKSLTQMLVQVLPAKLPRGGERLKWEGVQKSYEFRESVNARHARCDTWEGLTREYSLSSASLFLGVWVSTAIFQLVLIGGLVTCMLASLSAWRALWNVFWRLFPVLVVYLILRLTDWFVLVSGPLLNKAVFEDHQLRRPVLWGFYTLIRSLVGLAVGMLFALWRLFLLTAMNFVHFNRLDKVILPARLDHGHKSLFAMAMMNAMLQKDGDHSCSEGINYSNAASVDLQAGKDHPAPLIRSVSQESFYHGDDKRHVVSGC